MKTISQVAKLTGVSIRTLQYYDKIGLLKPSALTPAGYRLYDENALQSLQQILFFRELGFSLKDIIKIMQNPDFDKIAAFKKQKELLLLKRNRTDRLIQLLERLEKGETCMSFKEFDLSEYIHALEVFKKDQSAAVVKHWGSIENFDLFLQKIKDNEENVARLAIQQFGSVENYTKAMKYNLDHFSEMMETSLSEEAQKIAQQSDKLYEKLTCDLSRDVSSTEVQSVAHSLILLLQENSENTSFDKPYIQLLIDAYSGDYVKKITDSKYGAGASDYIVKAFQRYLEYPTFHNN